MSSSRLDADDDREGEAEEQAARVAGDGARGDAADNPVTVPPAGAKEEEQTVDEEDTGLVDEAGTGLAKAEPAEEDTGLAEVDTGLAGTGLVEAEPAEKEGPPGEEDREDREAKVAADGRAAERADELAAKSEAEEAQEDREADEEEREDREAEAEVAADGRDARRAGVLETEGKAEEAERQREEEDEEEAREAGVDVDLEPGAAPLVDAVKALEQAARVEAELAQQGPAAPAVAGAVDLERLTSILGSIQTEMSALRTLVDTLGIEIRERLDILHEEILVAQGRLGPEPPPPTTVEPWPDTMRAADDVTRELPPIPLSTAPPASGESAESEPPEGVAKRATRRVLLVVLLVLLGVIIAGAIVAVGVFGWDQIRSQITGS